MSTPANSVTSSSSLQFVNLCEALCYASRGLNWERLNVHGGWVGAVAQIDPLARYAKLVEFTDRLTHIALAINPYTDPEDLDPDYGKGLVSDEDLVKAELDPDSVSNNTFVCASDGRVTVHVQGHID